MRINHKIQTAEEISTFLIQHKQNISAYMLGEGSKLLGCRGVCSAEDLYDMTANPDHTGRQFVHIKIATKPNIEVSEAVEAILEQIESIEQHIYGYQVKDNVLGSFKAGMLAGLIFHGSTKNEQAVQQQIDELNKKRSEENNGEPFRLLAPGKKTAHGHLIVIPLVAIHDGKNIFPLQLDTKRLLKAFKGKSNE